MRGVLAAVFHRRGVVVVTGPEQHAATVAETIEQGSDRRRAIRADNKDAG